MRYSHIGKRGLVTTIALGSVAIVLMLSQWQSELRAQNPPPEQKCIFERIGEAIGDALCSLTNCTGRTKAFGINTAGQIVGGIDGTGVWNGYLFSGDSVTLIQVPGSVSTRAFGINTAGQIVGNFRDGTTIGRTHGFLLSEGKFSTIDVPGSTLTDALGISEAGQIVGDYTTDAADIFHGFLLSEGKFSTIDVPGAPSTEAFGINTAGQIVGAFLDTAGKTHGFLLSEGKFSTIDVPGSTLTDALGISEAGQIVGFFEDSTGEHAFLATPIFIDDYKCYKAEGHSPSETVNLEDQFGKESGVQVGKPAFFCNPVNKNEEGILNPKVHLTCYEIKSDDGRKRDVVVENQFGDQTLTVDKPQLLCVPSGKTAVVPHEDKDGGR